MKFKQVFIFGVLFLFILLLLCSCHRDQIKLWRDYEHVLTADGEVFDYSLPQRQKFVVTDFSMRLLGFYKEGQVPGKIDSIIHRNPDWAFVFYCKGEAKDSAKLKSWLKEIGATFPVILDPDNTFSKINRINEGSYGIICDEDGRIIIPAAGMIGDRRTPFDSQFAKAKTRNEE